ncbi:hypothetical protein OG851_31015 [Streptomyces sp. NBC_00161]|uniref:DUF6801 domain-containing protein n=1 Tax=Streptomyces sp. NBC_00161 TaxID=2975671 RepID=UPI003250B70D
MRTGKHTHTQNPPTPRGPLRLVMATAVASGVLALPGTGPAAADPVSLTLRYTCSTSLIGNLPVTVRIHSDLPESAEVGKPTQTFPVSAAVPVPADAAMALAGIGVTAVEGTVEAQARVTAPEGERRVKMPVHVKAGVPAAGPFHIEASGSAPALTFRRAGSARITVDDLVAHLALKNARGDAVYPGEIAARCTPDPGQNNVLASFHITDFHPGRNPDPDPDPGPTPTPTPTPDPGTDTDQAASGATGPAGPAAATSAPTTNRTTSDAPVSTPRDALPETGADPDPDPDLRLLGGAGLLSAAAATLFATRRHRRRLRGHLPPP